MNITESSAERLLRRPRRCFAGTSTRYRQALRKTEHGALQASLLLALFASLVSVNARADTDADFARAKKCMSCHAIDEKRIGPPFKAVAAKYANDKDAEAKLARKIREGGTGAWGVLVMPPNDVTPAEAQRLAHWVLMQK